MHKPRRVKHYQVKRTVNGRVRFNLDASTHQLLRELLHEWAGEPAPEQLAGLDDVYVESGRRLAQELVTRRALLLTLAGENRFVLPMSEATTVLALLWLNVQSEFRRGPGLQLLFGNLHQVLS